MRFFNHVLFCCKLRNGCALDLLSYVWASFTQDAEHFAEGTAQIAGHIETNMSVHTANNIKG